MFLLGCARLKDPKNQYMRFADLKKEYLAKKDPKLEIPSSTFLKEFVKKHVKHFQVGAAIICNSLMFKNRVICLFGGFNPY